MQRHETTQVFLGPILGWLLLAVTAAHSAPIETPNASDIPRPVPADLSLAGDAQPDIGRFLMIRKAKSPSLSPDGRQLAFESAISGVAQLWVVDASGGWPRQLTFGEPLTFHEWSPAGDAILYGTDRGGDEREGYYLITPDGLSERELLAPSAGFREFGGFTRDGSKIAYATTERNGIDFDLHLLDLGTGEDRQALRGRRGLYPVSWRPDSGAVILTQARGEDAVDVYLFDLERGELKTLFAPADASHYMDFAWRPDGQGFYMATNQERELRAVAYYDVASAQLEWVATPAHEVEGVHLSADGDLLAWTTNVDSYSALHARRLSRQEEVSVPKLPRGVYTLKWAARAPVAAITVESPNVPSDIWVWNAASGDLHRATRSDSAGLDLAKMTAPEHYSFAARDGVTIYGLLYLPPTGTGKGTDAAKPPLLLAVHGGPTGQARPKLNAIHQYLLRRGIAVFDLNFRGSTGYGKSFARLNDRRLRDNELYDLADALAWLDRQGLVDTRRAAVMGGSYGGYLTMAAVTRLSEHFAAGVAFVGVSNWLTALAGASPQLKASDLLEYGDIDDPEDREFFRQVSPITHIDKVRSPVMVIHGVNDPRDPVSESDQFVRAIRERGGEVEYLRFPDEGHGLRKLSNQIIAYRRVAAFLERILKP